MLQKLEEEKRRKRKHFVVEKKEKTVLFHVPKTKRTPSFLLDHLTSQ